MVPIIVRADDAGSAPEANRGIAECADAGVVKNVSVMAVCPWLADAAERLAHRTDIEFGFHFALNAEWDAVPWRPVLDPAQVPSLVTDAGTFLPMPGDLHERGFAVSEAVAEAEAQLQAIRAAGFSVSYLDEHCGVSWISESLETALADLAGREGLLYVKHCAMLPASYDLRYEYAETSPATIDETGATPLLWVTHPGIDEPGGVMQSFYLHGEPNDGTVARDRDAERRTLCDPRLPETLRRVGVQPATYSEIFGGNPAREKL